MESCKWSGASAFGSRPEGRQPGMVIGCEQPLGGGEVFVEERPPVVGFHGRPEAQAFEQPALDGTGLGHSPLDVGPERGFEAVEVQAEDAAAIRFERGRAAFGVEPDEPVGPEPIEEEVDQRRTLEVGLPLVPVVSVGSGELAEGEPRPSSKRPLTWNAWWS